MSNLSDNEVKKRISEIQKRHDENVTKTFSHLTQEFLENIYKLGYQDGAKNK